MEGISEAEAIEEIAALFDVDERRLGDVDSEQMAQAWGITRTKAIARLNRLVREGQLEKHNIDAGKHELVVWRKAEAVKLHE